jgi:hypothetical protein
MKLFSIKIMHLFLFHQAYRTICFHLYNIYLHYQYDVRMQANNSAPYEVIFLTFLFFRLRSVQRRYFHKMGFCFLIPNWFSRWSGKPAGYALTLHYALVFALQLRKITEKLSPRNRKVQCLVFILNCHKL